MEEMHLELWQGREGRAEAREHVPIGGGRRGAAQAGEQPLPTASLHHIYRRTHLGFAAGLVRRQNAIATPRRTCTGEQQCRKWRMYAESEEAFWPQNREEGESWEERRRSGGRWGAGGQGRAVAERGWAWSPAPA
jgi:hypothetical protein